MEGPENLQDDRARPDDEGKPRRGQLADRLIGTLVAGAALGVLGVAAWLTPAVSGMGTHTQLGLSPCGFLASTGLPCFTCGMTTATSLAADGRLLEAAWTQPAGLVFALLLGALVWLGAWLAISGRPAGPVLAGIGRSVVSPRGLLAGLVIVGGSWAYKATQVAANGWHSGDAAPTATLVGSSRGG